MYPKIRRKDSVFFVISQKIIEFLQIFLKKTRFVNSFSPYFCSKLIKYSSCSSTSFSQEYCVLITCKLLVVEVFQIKIYFV